jgi:hypothetical protein
VTPDLRQQLLTCDDAITMGDEVGEHVEHLGLDVPGAVEMPELEAEKDGVAAGDESRSVRPCLGRPGRGRESGRR